MQIMGFTGITGRRKVIIIETIRIRTREVAEAVMGEEVVVVVEEEGAEVVVDALDYPVAAGWAASGRCGVN